jgi:hypothetical protein
MSESTLPVLAGLAAGVAFIITLVVAVGGYVPSVANAAEVDENIVPSLRGPLTFEQNEVEYQCCPDLGNVTFAEPLDLGVGAEYRYH